VAALLNALAEKRGWPHCRDYAVAVERLYNETGDKELVAGFSLAERSHSNFYHILSPRGFQLHREAVMFTQKLKSSQRVSET